MFFNIRLTKSFGVNRNYFGWVIFALINCEIFSDGKKQLQIAIILFACKHAAVDRDLFELGIFN